MNVGTGTDDASEIELRLCDSCGRDKPDVAWRPYGDAVEVGGADGAADGAELCEGCWRAETGCVDGLPAVSKLTPPEDAANGGAGANNDGTNGTNGTDIPF